MTKKLLSLIVFVLFGIGQPFSSPPQIAAQTCMPQRVINQYRCVSETGQCQTFVSVRTGYACSRSGSSAASAQTNCDNGCGGGPGSCASAYCSVYQPNTYACAVEAFTASCSGPPACDVRGTIRNCTSALDSCTESNQPLNQQCYYTPPVGLTPPPGGGGCSGDCFTGLGNCGEVGRVPVGGSCSNGGLCCGFGGGGTPCTIQLRNIPPVMYSGQTYSFQAYAAGAINWWDGYWGWATGQPWLGTFSPWAHGTGPTFDTTFTATTVGSSVIRFRVTEDNENPPGTYCTATYPIQVIQGPTSTPANCGAMGAVTGSQLVCTSSTGSTGVVRWNWPAVAGVTVYSISLSTSSGAVITPVQNINATSLNCASGTCQYDSSGLAANSYVLSVRPISGSCMPPSTTTVSNTVAISFCPVNQVRVVAKTIAVGATSCTDVNSSTAYANPVSFSFAPALTPLSQTQTGSSPVVWNGIAPNTYTVTASAPPDYNVQFACWTKTGGAPFTNGLSARVESGETLSWQIGYTLGQAWARVVGGDAIICQNVTSPIPASLGANRHFMTSAAVGSPGIVYYGTDYDFDSDVLQKGENNVSSTDWLAQESGTLACTNNWYQFLLNKYGLTTTAADRGAGTYTQNTFPSRAQPYKVSGNMTTQGTWNYNTNGENVVIFVEGDLRINGEIRIPSRSFVAFVVQGNIIVDSSVGGNVGSSTPNVEGVYVTSGGFQTGVTNNNGSAKLIVNGIVIANSFNLQRDLDEQTANTTTPAEEFRYNPMFLLTLPNEFMDMKIKWEEVAP